MGNQTEFAAAAGTSSSIAMLAAFQMDLHARAPVHARVAFASAERAFRQMMQLVVTTAPTAVLELVG